MSQPSRTYKLLYYDIIEELFYHICSSNINYCVQCKIEGDKPAIAIWKKFEAYKAKALENMAGSRLDRHKLASCICGAIIEAKPLTGFGGATILKNANDIFALYVGLTVLKYYMTNNLTKHLKDTDPGLQIKANRYLRDTYSMKLPSMAENICDTQGYEKNLSYALYRTHEKCPSIGRECFHYDIWAYAKIFYHLEMYNREPLQKLYQEYLRSL